MSNGIEKYQPPEISDLDEWAKKLYESDMFTDLKSAAQAFVKIAAGAEMGLTPFQSITGVHFIQNKPVVGAGLLASMLDRAPYNYTTDWEPDITAPEACTITVFKHGVERGKARFSLDDAKRAGLTGGNWQKYPTDMLFARAVSQAARRYAPGAMGTTFYVEAHGETEIQPEGVTPKPRTRVTAEVIPAEPVEGEVVDTSTKALLAGMSAHAKAELYQRCGIEQRSTLRIVKAKLVDAYLLFSWSAVGDDPAEPDPVAVLEEFRRLDREAAAAPVAQEAFEHGVETGEWIEDGDQVKLA